MAQNLNSPSAAPQSEEAGAVNPSPRVLRRVVAASFVGNFVEWFDYAVYGYLATVIAVVFFPEAAPTTGLLATFAVFAISFVIRPIGGLVWGHFGDKIGRRTALSLSILIMSASTFCIGLIPGFDQIGYLAPVLLLLVRMVQGFSAAGEYAGASAFLAEYAPDRKRGLFTSVVPASTAAGLLFGSLIAALLTAVLSTEQLNGWGWRLPFLLAAPMGLIGRYIRLKLEDTPKFQEMEQKVEANAPLSILFTHHRRAIVIAFGVTCLNAVGFYLILSYMPTYLSEVLHVGHTASFVAASIALACYIVFIFGMGALSDRFGRKRVLIGASICFAVFTVPLFSALGAAGIVGVVVIQIVLCAFLTMNDGTLPTFLSEIFPTQVRYSGFAFSFNTANALFGGTAPFVATLLIEVTGNPLAPAWYLVAAALVAMGSMLMARETSQRPLADT
ncbi:L-Proline/Glycine betaine transporter ProP [Rhodococcus wratislaviensis]|uniref:Putative proline/betaine transporter n=1 Tax=Rhodococcus wratislaviensis TaxID=44752 RepID=A0A402C080_RHOWR|nr:MFS transporter [Rhodococcus wratislaviensis]GCE36996.1 L-Proline/Glycine betaine transporter ProP [Rhodococcus wratislaviensis]